MDSWQIERQYDDTGRRSKLQYPSTNEVEFDCPLRGQLVEVTCDQSENSPAVKESRR